MEGEKGGELLRERKKQQKEGKGTGIPDCCSGGGGTKGVERVYNDQGARRGEKKKKKKKRAFRVKKYKQRRGKGEKEKKRSISRGAVGKVERTIVGQEKIAIRQDFSWNVIQD